MVLLEELKNRLSAYEEPLKDLRDSDVYKRQLKDSRTYMSCKLRDTIFYGKGEILMKRMKKFLLLALCAVVLSTATACGSEKDADNGADQTKTEDNVNDATKGTDTDDKSDKGNGIVNDAVDDVTDGVRCV